MRKLASMTGRERIRVSLGGHQPDRTPFAWGFGPTDAMTKELEAWCVGHGCHWSALRAQVSDVLVLDEPYIGPPLGVGQPPYVGVWGIGTTDVAYGAGTYQEFTGHPLAGLEDPGGLDAMRWPSPDWFDYAGMAQRARQHDPHHEKAWMLPLTFGGNPLEIYTWMTGMEETMINLVAQPLLVRAALERICAYFMRKVELAATTLGDEIDLLLMADDLGGQSGLLFSRETYRSVLQPFHRRLIDHARGVLPQVKIFYHSDGAVFTILPDLIDSGIDGLEAVQTDAVGMDPQRLKDVYGGRLAFEGGISVQALLPMADARTVQRECERLCRIFGHGGRYIAGPTHAIQAGTPVENVWAMLRGVLGEKIFG